MRPPILKALFCGEADGGFSVFLRSTHLTAELMEPGSTGQGKDQAKRVCHLLRKGHRFVNLCPPLGWIPQKPQRRGSNVTTRHASILPIEERRGAMLLGVVKSDSLCRMRV